MRVPNGAAFVDTHAIAIAISEFAKLSDIPIFPTATGPFEGEEEWVECLVNEISRNPANRDSPLERPDLMSP
jgi:hypothetical protein